MSPPKLVIFDLDGTLIRRSPSVELICKGLLESMTQDVGVQVAVATFNQGSHGFSSGTALVRHVLDQVCDNSCARISDDFIKAWCPDAIGRDSYGKNRHITKIIAAYVNKYKVYPKQIELVDDDPTNVYLAENLPYVSAIWTPMGATFESYYARQSLATRVVFECDTMRKVGLMSLPTDLLKFIYFHPLSSRSHVFFLTVYLPTKNEAVVYKRIRSALTKMSANTKEIIPYHPTDHGASPAVLVAS